MRRASRLALAALLAITAGPLASLPAAAAPPAPAPVGVEPSAELPLSAAGRYIVLLKSGKDVEKATGRARNVGVAAERTFRRTVRGYAAKLSPDQLAKVRLDADVAAVVPDEVITIAAQSRPTGIRRVFAPDNATARIDGADGDIASGQRVDADVAIVDTGIDRTHPDLNVVGGISCATTNQNAWGSDPNGHGTHVAGTVGALDNGIGVVGVAPGVRLWSVRILNSGGAGLLSWYVCGLDWITAQRDPLDPTRPLFEAVNMSVAKTGTDDNNCGFSNADVIHRAICRLVDSGVTVVAAAGNNGFNAAKLKPASYNEVITVSALADTDGKAGGEGGSLCYSFGGYDQDDTFADFSNYGADVDLIAPGKCINSTLPGNRYGYISGTSMAAPHVTGAAALYKASRPLATPAQVRTALRAAGNLDWNIATDPDSAHEPLLDVSHIVAMGDWALDATPGTSSKAVVGAAGGTVTVPVQLIRAEDFPGRVDLQVASGAPFAPQLGDTSLTGQGATTTSLTFTVPPGTPNGSFQIPIEATDGTRRRSSSFLVRVDTVSPTGPRPALQLRAGTQLTPAGVPGRGSWGAASDLNGIGGYQLRWRIDGVMRSPFAVGAGARSTNLLLANGSAHSLLLRARDTAGNWSPWRESPVFRTALSQDTNPSLGRRGPWTRAQNPAFSGGSSIWSARKGAAVSRTFVGRAVAVVVTGAPRRGKATIYIDGKAVTTVDTNRSAATYRLIAYSRTWGASGRHNVRVVVLGTAGRPRVDVDAFVIVP